MIGSQSLIRRRTVCFPSAIEKASMRPTIQTKIQSWEYGRPIRSIATAVASR